MADNSLLSNLLEKMRLYEFEENEVQHVQDFTGEHSSTFEAFKEHIQDVEITEDYEILFEYSNVFVMFKNGYFVFEFNPLSWRFHLPPYPVSERPDDLVENLKLRKKYLNG